MACGYITQIKALADDCEITITLSRPYNTAQFADAGFEERAQAAYEKSLKEHYNFHIGLAELLQSQAEG